MKTELKAKFLQHLIQRKQGDKGFTLIELLVVIIIIGVLSAIALPSFLNQAAKARAAEAKSNVGSMNRAQQAFYLENQCFSENVGDLGLSMVNSTDNFNYKSQANGNITGGVTNLGTSKKTDIKSYAGATFYIASSGTNTEGATVTVLCERKQAGAVEAAVPAAPAANSNQATCNADNTTKQVK